jgi:threonine/homoserine/homoserine lactone efflux protein
MNEFAAFVLTGFALTGSPGPAVLGVAAISSSLGMRAAVPVIAGLIIGMVLVMLTVATGLMGLLLAIPGAASVVGLLASAYILWLAWQIGSGGFESSKNPTGPKPGVLTGLVLAVTNPKAYAAMLALFSSFQLHAEPVTDVAVKTAVLIVVMLIVDIAWAQLGTALARFAHQPRTRRIINIAFAVALLASVILALAA